MYELLGHRTTARPGVQLLVDVLEDWGPDATLSGVSGRGLVAEPPSDSLHNCINHPKSKIFNK